MVLTCPIYVNLAALPVSAYAGSLPKPHNFSFILSNVVVETVNRVRINGTRFIFLVVVEHSKLELVFAEFQKKNGPRGGVLARFFAPGVGILHFFGPWDGEFAHSKKSPGFCPGGGGGMVRLGID